MNKKSRTVRGSPTVRSEKRLARELEVIENEFDQFYRILSPFWALQSSFPDKSNPITQDVNQFQGGN